MTIKVAPTGVTSKKNSPKYNVLRERLTSFATLELECFPLTAQQELQQFCYYLTKKLDLELSKKKTDSLILTVHCRTLEILERLWEDYCSGHLDEVAEECFLTDETAKTKEEMKENMDTISVETTILRKEYERCKKFLTEISGKLSSHVAMAYLGPEISPHRTLGKGYVLRNLTKISKLASVKI